MNEVTKVMTSYSSLPQTHIIQGIPLLDSASMTTESVDGEEYDVKVTETTFYNYSSVL